MLVDDREEQRIRIRFARGRPRTVPTAISGSGIQSRHAAVI
jgi:hypothetical protein